VVNGESKSDVYRGTIARVIPGNFSLENDSFEILFDNDGEKEVLDLVAMYGMYL
jgi:hypothetical protein